MSGRIPTNANIFISALKPKRETKPQCKLIESFVISKFTRGAASLSYEKLPIINTSLD